MSTSLFHVVLLFWDWISYVDGKPSHLLLCEKRWITSWVMVILTHLCTGLAFNKLRRVQGAQGGAVSPLYPVKPVALFWAAHQEASWEPRFGGFPTVRRFWSGPWTCWRDHLIHQAWERLGIPLEGQESTAEESDIWNPPLRVLQLRHGPRINNWKDRRIEDTNEMLWIAR